ncbi:hypothetical protein ACSZMJ_18845 [Aeromonas caviae]|uniref:hypothetical protein n=1 Tax=Aeromonas caviae TaxID=648 RepID=UPI002B4A0C02|nr:hypothetical protein [Aeromonas caviae]
MNKFFIVFFLLFFSVVINAHAEKNSQSSVENGSLVNYETIYKLKAFEELKIENKIIKEYHDSLLSTVYWAIGAVLGVSALLFGFGWWSNFKIHEKDKSTLLNETSRLIIESEIKIAGIVDEKNSKNVDNLLASLKSTNERIDKIYNSIEDYSSELNEIKSGISKIKIELSLQNKTIKYNEYSQELNLRSVEERLWDLKKVYNNVLLAQLESLEASIKMNHILGSTEHNFDLTPILERIKTTIEDNILGKPCYISDFTTSRTVEILKSIGGEYSIKVNDILSLVERINVTPSQFSS